MLIFYIMVFIKIGDFTFRQVTTFVVCPSSRDICLCPRLRYIKYESGALITNEIWFHLLKT